MADDSFDAVIIGGGTKALFLAMYLIEYGGILMLLQEVFRDDLEEMEDNRK